MNFALLNNISKQLKTTEVSISVGVICPPLDILNSVFAVQVGL
jgi:hypothetical protein